MLHFPAAHKDTFSVHFATENKLLNEENISAAKESNWSGSKLAKPALGQMLCSKLQTSKASASPEDDRIVVVSLTALAFSLFIGKLLIFADVVHRLCQMNPRFREKFEDYTTSKGLQLPTELLDILASYRDFMFTRTDFDQQDQLRAIMSLHAMNHIAKTRQKVLKNNEALASNPDGKDRDTRDQGFTRPKVLILCPMRNAAVPWMNHLMHFSLATQGENKTRFLNDFSLPEGAVDKLARNEKDADGHPKYPRDHRENFHGNIDDTFRVGLKVTRKSIKLYSEFYQSDLIIASPLGLRTSIEKQK